MIPTAPRESSSKKNMPFMPPKIRNRSPPGSRRSAVIFVGVGGSSSLT
jgi:hypothetical protein